MWAVIIGLIGGIIAAIYYWILTGGLHLVWDVVKPGINSLSFLPWGTSFTVVVLTTAGGFLVGLCMKFMRTPGEISAVVNNIHIEKGKLDSKQNPSMFLNSLTSIIFGGSAGPEAPLVQLIGSSASTIGEKLELHSDLIRTFTFCGMAAALGAFFGAPIGGALFALEIPHMRGLEYYEALIPSIVSAFAAFLLFRAFIGYSGAIYNLPQIDGLSILTVLKGLLMGIVGALIASIFAIIFRNIDRLLEPLKRFPILLGTLGGSIIGLFAFIMPSGFITTPLFWSEYQIPELLNGISDLQLHYGLWIAIGLLALLVFFKMCAIGFTLHSGFRGGFIFPLFFIGAASGIAISLATSHFIPMSVAIISLMAAVNVGVTKTPLSTSVILISLTGAGYLPVIAAASITSYICTERLRFINTQQHRTDNSSPMHRVWRWKE